MAADKNEDRHLSPSELRKANKPLMEKKRRARINDSLVELKSLVLEALKRDTSRYSKLEKADILEMTVKHLRQVQRQQMAVAMATDSTVITKYRSGFNECATEVSRYLTSIDGLDSKVKDRLLGHLGHCIQKVNTPPGGNMMNQMAPHHQLMAPVHVQIPNTTSLSAMPGSTALPSAGPYQNCQITGAFQMMPGTLPNGQVVLLPSSSPYQMGVSAPVHAMPLYTPQSRSPSPESFCQSFPERAHENSTPERAFRNAAHQRSFSSDSGSSSMSSPDRASSPVETLVRQDSPQDLRVPPKMPKIEHQVAPAVRPVLSKPSPVLPQASKHVVPVQVKEESMWRPW